MIERQDVEKLNALYTLIASLFGRYLSWIWKRSIISTRSSRLLNARNKKNFLEFNNQKFWALWGYIIEAVAEF